MRSLQSLAVTVWFAVRALDIGLPDLVLVAGLCLLAVGLRAIYPPLAYIIPGAILVWLAIPPRPPAPPPPRRRLR